MPATVYHAKSNTVPDGPPGAYGVYPSDWNSQHNVTLAPVGSELIGAFSNDGNVTFGLDSNGYISATVAGGGGSAAVTVSVSNGSFTAGALSFGNSNGLTFYLTDGQVVGSYTVPATAGLLSSVVFSAANTSTTATALTFDNSNGVSFGLTNGSVTASVATNYAGTGSTFAGTNVSGSLTINGGGVDLALSVAAQSVQPVAVSGSNGSFAFSTLTLGDLNGLTHYTSNGSVVASYTVPTVTQYFSNTATTFNGANVSGSLTLNTAGLDVSLSVLAQSVQTQNVWDATLAGNTTGTLALISSGTLTLAGGNNVTLSQAGNAVTIQAGSAANAAVNITAGGSSVNASTLEFSNANGVTFGLSTAGGVGTITASVPQQSVQTQASGNIGGTGFTTTTTNGSVIVGTNNTAGVTLAVPPYITTQTAQTQNLVDVSLSGNTAGALALVSSGTLILAGGNNITLSQNGQSVTISAANAGGAQTGISGIQVSNTTWTSGTVTFQNANGISFGSSGANGITASYTVPSTAGLLSSIVVSASNTSTTATGLTFSDSNGLSFGLTNGTITGSYTVPTQSVQSLGVYAEANTTLTTSSTYDARSLSIAGEGAVIVGNSNGSVLVSQGTGTTFNGANISGSMTHNSLGDQLSLSVAAQSAQSAIQALGVSNTGNTAGNTGVSTGINWIIAASNNITASESTAGGGPNTIWMSGPTLTQYFSGTGTTFNGANISGSLTLNTAGLDVSLSVAAPGGGAAIEVTGANGSSVNASTLAFSNSNGMTLGVSTAANGATVTGSYTVPTQTVQTLSAIVSGNTTGNTSAMTFDARSLSLQGYGAASVGLSTTNTGSSVLISVATQTAQTVGVYAEGNTTLTTSSTYDARSLSFAGEGVVIVGNSNGSIVISGGTGTTFNGANISGSLTNNSAGIGVSLSVAPQSAQSAIQALGVSNTGNTAGNTGLSTGINWVLAASNNITASESTAGGGPNTIWVSGPTLTQFFSNTGTTFNGVNVSGSMTLNTAGLDLSLSAAAGGGGATTAGFYAESNTTFTTSTTVPLSAISFNAMGGVSVGNSNGSVVISGVTTAAQTAQTLGIYMEGNTTLTTSTTVDARSLSFYGSGIVTVGESAGSVIINAPSGGGGGDTGLTGYVSNNTTNNTSGTLALSALTFEADGGVSVGFSNGHVQFSAPPLSSLSGTGLVSISSNGSTIYVGVPGTSISKYFYPPGYVALNTSGIGQNSISLEYFTVPVPIVASDMRALFSVSAGTDTSASTNTYGITLNAGIYTLTGSTVSLMESGSQDYSGTWSTNSTGSINGVRDISVPLAATLTPGEYWLGLVISTSTVNGALGMSIYQLSAQNTVYEEIMSLGAATNSSRILNPFNGIYSTTSSALPASVDLTQYTGSGTYGSRANVFFILENYTVQ